MRYPEGHKAAVRSKIVGAAAKALRRHGVDGVSIPALMKRVGLTHGGFYVHFKNRDDLVAAAIMSAAERTGKQVFEDQPSLAETLRIYLSKEHLDHPGEGCVLSALGTDAVRQPAPVRRAFAEAARGFLVLLESKTHPSHASTTENPAELRELHDDTLVKGAAMIGALVLGRLVHDDALAERILAAVRAADG